MSDKVRDHQEELLTQLQKREGVVRSKVLDVEVAVFPGVFPTGATDTFLMAKHMPIIKGTRVLELTTGSGILSVIAGLKGATGIACDINPLAVKNAQHNFDDYGLPFQAIESNVFQRVPDRKFDLIMVNPPYLEGEVQDPLQHAFFGAQALVEEVFSRSSEYLEEGGKILMTWAEWASLEYLEIAHRFNWQEELLERCLSLDGERSYRIDLWSKG
jgi:release factor glutamine methyltransferase